MEPAGEVGFLGPPNAPPEFVPLKPEWKLHKEEETTLLSMMSYLPVVNDKEVMSLLSLSFKLHEIKLK